MSYSTSVSLVNGYLVVEQGFLGTSSINGEEIH